MRLVSADRRDLEALLGRMDVRAMVPSGCDGGAEWPPEPSGRDRCGLLMLLALIALVSLVLSAWKLRVKRLSSLAKREAASLKGYCEMRGPLNKCSLEFERQMIAKVRSAVQTLACSFPQNLYWMFAEIRYQARGGENLAGKSDNARYKGT